MTQARIQIQTALDDTQFRQELLDAARADVGETESEELVQQLSFETLRAADKRETLERPEAFVWACYKRCARDCVRKLERQAQREARS